MTTTTRSRSPSRRCSWMKGKHRYVQWMTMEGARSMRSSVDTMDHKWVGWNWETETSRDLVSLPHQHSPLDRTPDALDISFKLKLRWANSSVQSSSYVSHSVPTFLGPCNRFDGRRFFIFASPSPQTTVMIPHSDMKDLPLSRVERIVKRRSMTKHSWEALPLSAQTESGVAYYAIPFTYCLHSFPLSRCIFQFQK